MNVTNDPEFVATHVRVDYDLATNQIIATLPPTTDSSGETVAETRFSMSPAEAVELAGGITAAAVSAAAHLLRQREAGPVERVTDSGSPS